MSKTKPITKKRRLKIVLVVVKNMDRGAESKTRKAKQAKIRRENESPVERKIRLEKQQMRSFKGRMRKKQAGKKTPTKEAMRKRKERDAETPEHRAARLGSARINAANKRASETPHQRDKRLEYLRNCATLRLNSETRKESTERLDKQKHYAALRRASESHEEKEKRMEGNRCYSVLYRRMVREAFEEPHMAGHPFLPVSYWRRRQTVLRTAYQRLFESVIKEYRRDFAWAAMKYVPPLWGERLPPNVCYIVCLLFHRKMETYFDKKRPELESFNREREQRRLEYQSHLESLRADKSRAKCRISTGIILARQAGLH